MTLATGKTRGFSLLEIMIVLLLVGIFTLIAVPSFNALTHGDLKKTANQMVGLIRDSYSRSSLSGKTVRIVFDLDSRKYCVEESADTVRIQTQEDEEKEREDKERDEELAKTLKSPDFKAIEDEAGEKKTLPEDVYFKSIWTDRMTERVTKGQAALYFFPDGYTEEAQIVLSDNPEGTRIYDLVVEPLTGTVTIEDSELPIETK